MLHELSYQLLRFKSKTWMCFIDAYIADDVSDVFVSVDTSHMIEKVKAQAIVSSSRSASVILKENSMFNNMGEHRLSIVIRTLTFIAIVVDR